MSRPCNQLGQTTKTIANWDALAGRNAYIDNSDYVQWGAATADTALIYGLPMIAGVAVTLATGGAAAPPLALVLGGLVSGSVGGFAGGYIQGGSVRQATIRGIGYGIAGGVAGAAGGYVGGSVAGEFCPAPWPAG